MLQTRTISILLVDDSELVRMGLKTLLNAPTDPAEPSLQVVGEAATVAAAVSESARLQPDVVLLDIRLPDGSGLNACGRILAMSPDTRILVLTSVIDDNLVYDAMSNGAHGYLLKEINAQGLRQAIIAVAAGKFILDPTLTTRVLNLMRDGGNAAEQDKLAVLSAQERRVLALVAEGMTNKEIAEQLDLSDKTVKNYLSSVFEKLKIKRRSQAAVLFLENRGRNEPPAVTKP
ncbi:MAG TPA: response regulator transcription factor [Lacunisphaera sp.]|nr:response regulator transcription factor [Lacunisphaera sp.]